MMKATLNGQEILCCGAFHTRIARILDFPDYYGKNLDALYDCLTDLPEGTELTITHFDALETALGSRYAALIRRVLNDAAANSRFVWYEE